VSERGSNRQYAAHRKALGLTGGSHVAVGKAIMSGRIAASVGEDGKIDFAMADALWSRNTDAIQGARNPGGVKKESAAPSPAPAPAPPAPAPALDASVPTAAPGKEKPTLVEAQTMRAIYAANREKLAFEKESGSKVDANETKVLAFNRARAARNALMAAGARIAPLLVGLDLFQLTITLEDELRKVAEEISRDALTPI
jgi:hypothetical protein